MNIFRLTADLAHLIAIVILLIKIWKTRSCAGISCRAQVLFLIVFVCRYLDIFTNFVSVYNSLMKVYNFKFLYKFFNLNCFLVIFYFKFDCNSLSYVY